MRAGPSPKRSICMRRSDRWWLRASYAARRRLPRAWGSDAGEGLVRAWSAACRRGGRCAYAGIRALRPRADGRGGRSRLRAIAMWRRRCERASSLERAHALCASASVELFAGDVAAAATLAAEAESRPVAPVIARRSPRRWRSAASPPTRREKSDSMRRSSSGTSSGTSIAAAAHRVGARDLPAAIRSRPSDCAASSGPWGVARARLPRAARARRAGGREVAITTLGRFAVVRERRTGVRRGVAVTQGPGSAQAARGTPRPADHP